MPSVNPDSLALEAVLLDFHRAPGKYLVALRQPTLLFASIKRLLQMADGRGEGGEAVEPHIARAAQFFIRAALLRPSANHYALLGLTDDATAADIKDRYRQMMRLLHPDFAGASWPADAATRVNNAYEVLSSPERREAYDGELKEDSGAALRPGVQPAAHGMRRATPATSPRDERVSLRWLATGFGAVGAIGLALAWYTGQDKEMLVQRKQPAPARAPVVVATAPESKAPAFEAPVAAVSPIPEPAPAPFIASPAIPQPAPAVPQMPIISAALPTPATPSPRGLVMPAALAAPSPAMTEPVLLTVATNIPANTSAPAPMAQAAISPPPSPPPLAPPSPTSPPSPTLTEVHPALMQLIQSLEAGWGGRMLDMGDRGVRDSQGAQALARHFNELVEGVRPVQVTNVDLRSQTRDGRLIVNGRVRLKVRDVGAPTRELSLVAEYALKDGAPVLTRMARGE